MINLERNHYLDKHIVANTQRYYRSPTLKRIFSEINNRCPECHKPLGWIDINGDLSARKNQIAHIYSRKEFERFNLPLTEPYHIKSVDEIDNYHNLIVLCDKCHSVYDNSTTYKKYIDMLDIKKKLYESSNINELIYLLLDDTLDALSQQHFNEVLNTKPRKANYDRITLNKKLKKNKINHVKQEEIRSSVANYFVTIQECIEEYEQDNGFVRVVLNEFHEAYGVLKEKYEDKNSIVNKLTTSISDSIDESISDIVPLVIAFMIMKCEVLDNVAQ